eukprot:755164-Hanusia_phi.AAC.8
MSGPPPPWRDQRSTHFFRTTLQIRLRNRGITRQLVPYPLVPIPAIFSPNLHFTIRTHPHPSVADLWTLPGTSRMRVESAYHARTVRQTEGKEFGAKEGRRKGEGMKNFSI